jgi:DNA repair protein REV1
VYREKSLTFYTILMSYADEVQAVSIDEALVDVTQRVAELEQAPPELNEQPDVAEDYAKLLAEDIRADMREATDCEGGYQGSIS